MAALASARGKQVELVTNGTLLTREKARALLDAGVSRIWDSEEYRAFRQRVHEFKFAPCLFCVGCLWGQNFAVCP